MGLIVACQQINVKTPAGRLQTLPARKSLPDLAPCPKCSERCLCRIFFQCCRCRGPILTNSRDQTWSWTPGARTPRASVVGSRLMVQGVGP
jgi:hypothetical protein